jgi:HTH-type transcriptional regulator/antitoxin HipB
MLGCCMRLRTPNDIGHLVRAQRKKRGWTQADFAQRLGVSRLWILQLEQGKETAQVGLVLRALNELDISLDVDLRPASLNDPVRRPQLPDINLDDIIAQNTGPMRL